VTHDEWFWRFTPSQPLSYNSHYFVSHSWPSSVILPLNPERLYTQDDARTMELNDWRRNITTKYSQQVSIIRPPMNRENVTPTYWHFYTPSSTSLIRTESYKYIA
jgi:hypothetical protein